MGGTLGIRSWVPEVLGEFKDLAEADVGLARSILGTEWFNNYAYWRKDGLLPRFRDLVREHPSLADALKIMGHEWPFFKLEGELSTYEFLAGGQFSEADATRILSYSWITDGIKYWEANAIAALNEILRHSPERANGILLVDWFQDGPHDW